MKITYHRRVNSAELPLDSVATVHLISVKIEDIEGHAKTILNILNDTSWISNLNAVGRKSFEDTASRTINKLVDDFKSIDNTITSSFGQYMVSITAGQSLGVLLDHIVFPISELWKEKVTHNHGFDFHTESPKKLISFGEAKYSKNSNPYSDAALQIKEFIALGKDGGDAALLTHFASDIAIDNLINSSRGFSVAFSINSENIEDILSNALNSDLIIQLCKCCDELQIIGVSS